MSDTVTLVVHGTFAGEANWWRLGAEGHNTFADRLENELSRHGISGTVWKPALDRGLDYSSFAWSGRNRHRDRVQAAKKLSTNLGQLAESRSATAGDPLTVNFVAHSHGGNVVLEALRHLKPNVRIGRIALLGTPLITVKPAFRIARFVFSILVFTFLFFCLLFLLIQLGALAFTGHFWNTETQFGPGGVVLREGVRAGPLLALLVPILIVYGWLFWLAGNLLDVAWRVICRIFEPLAWLTGKSRTRVYGPSPSVLSKTLDGHPILLLTSYNDEADLSLQIGSAPAKLYREYAATEFSTFGRVLEFIFLRPFVLGLLLKALEMMLEVFSFGFSLWRTLFLDFEVAPLDERPYYPRNLLVQKKIELDLNAVMRAQLCEPVEVSAPHRPGLFISLQEVTREIKKQIQLRHSTYYENPRVIEQIADFLAGGKVQSVEPARAPSRKASSEFWEALLAANVALVAVFAWMAGATLAREIPYPMICVLVGLLGYMIPFALLGLTEVYWIIRRRTPTRLWRWFWIDWTAWAGMVFLAGLGIMFEAAA